MRMFGGTRSHISSMEISPCLAESVDEEVCCAGTISWVFINTCWAFSWGGSSKTGASRGLPRIPSQGAQVLANKVAISFVHP